MLGVVYSVESASGFKLVRDLIKPKIKSRNVLCRVKYGSLNPVDAKWLAGDKLPEFIIPAWKRLLQGTICGIDFSGTVVEALPGSVYNIGDQVFGTSPILQGSFAEYIVVPESTISLVPVQVSMEQAAAIPLVGLTALQLFKEFPTELSARHHVLVIGASGGTGHVAVQYAKHKGAAITAICGDNNIELVRSLGADVVISYQQSEENLFLALQAATNNGDNLFDCVLDTVTSKDARDKQHAYEYKLLTPDIWRQSLLKSLSDQERITSKLSTPLTHGFMMVTAKYVRLGGPSLDWAKAYLARYIGIDTFSKNHYLFWVKFPNTASQLREIGQLLANGKITVKIAGEFGMTQSEIDRAIELQMCRRTVGKILFRLSE